MQSRKHSHLEIITNQIVGIVIGWLIVKYLFPLMGVPVSYSQATASSAIFFVASYSRAYVIRRVFNGLAR